MLFKIAFRNVKRQIGGYLIYFITVALTVSLLFTLNSMIFSSTVTLIAESFQNEVRIVSAFLSVLLSIATAAVLGYGSRFLLRRRKKEFGLYLTIGMTRSDILVIFMTELIFTFIFSLGAGLALGIPVFQLIVAGITKFLQREFVFGEYSVSGLILTVIMVVVIFLLSSIVSMVYLRRVTVANLLQGEQVAEKTVRHPKTWFTVMIVFFVLLVISMAGVAATSGDTSIDGYALILVGGSLIGLLSVIMIYVGAMKSGVFYLLKNRKFSARGTRTFTLRQLSGRLSADSVMFGIIAVLMSVVIAGGSVFLTLVWSQLAGTQANNPYTVSMYMPYDSTGELTADLPEWVSTFGTVESMHQYTLYHLPGYNLHKYINGYYYSEDSVMMESDYLQLSEMIGYNVDPAGDGFIVLCNGITGDDWEKAHSTNYEGFEIELGDRSLPVSYVSSVREKLAVGGIANSYIVVAPDEVVDTYAINNARALTYCAVIYENGIFDEQSMLEFFNEKNNEPEYETSYSLAGVHYSNFFNIDISGMFAEYLMQMAAPWLWIVCFISIVFALLTMAVLGLKSVTSVTEDKRRYKLLYFAGATEKEVLHSLTVQLLLYFFLPFVVPLLMSVPILFICIALSGFMGGYMTALQIAVCVFLFSAVLLVLFGLYCAVTCIIARTDIRRTLRSVS